MVYTGVLRCIERNNEFLILSLVPKESSVDHSLYYFHIDESCLVSPDINVGDTVAIVHDDAAWMTKIWRIHKTIE